MASVATTAARAAKRAIDVCASLLLMTLLSPITLTVAALALLTSGRPLLFCQVRAGKGGRLFPLYKFRTMTAGSGGVPLPDDARLTRLGGLLRSCSLDELPQLWNVLRGDMSLVGPRPLVARYLDRYTPTQARRHEVSPGITGLAQVRGRNRLSWEEKFDLDVWYVDNWSLGLDARILWRTVLSVLRGEGGTPMPEFWGTAQARQSPRSGDDAPPLEQRAAGITPSRRTTMREEISP